MSQKKQDRSGPRRAPIGPWPLVMIVGGMALLGLVLYAVVQAGSGSSRPTVPVEITGAPRIKVDKDHVDLGDVRLGETVEVKFTVSNVGDRQLRFVEAPYVELVEGC